MRSPKRAFVLLALAASLAVAGCGGDDEGDPIPSATATALDNELNGVQDRLDEGSAGACRDILEGPRDPNMPRVEELVAAMPDGVDADVRAALEDSFDRLWELVQQDCDDKAQEEESQQEPEPEEPTQTETQTETTTTPPETETTETTPPAEEELPPEGDGNNDGGVPGDGDGDGGGGAFGPEDGE